MARLKRVFGFIRDSNGFFAGFCTVVIMAFVVIDVTGRNFGNPIYWLTEASLLLFVWLVYLGMARTQFLRGHVRVEFLLSRLSPRAGIISEAISWFLSLVFCLIVLIAGIVMAISSVKMLEGSYGVIHFPIWPGRIGLVFGLLLLCIQLTIDFVGELAKLRSSGMKMPSAKKGD